MREHLRGVTRWGRLMWLLWRMKNLVCVSFWWNCQRSRQFFYHSKQGEAKLIFPEFFEEAVENTPARILETHTHGSGMMYRNCFVRQELQFHLYDERFEWAKGREYEDTLFRLVFGRLLYPYQLSEKAKKKIYELFEGSHWNMHKMGSGKDAGERM